MWEQILNNVVYPAAGGIILILVSIGLKILATYMKSLTSKVDNEILKSIIAAAADGVEQQAATAEKTGQAKWDSVVKKTAALDIAKKDAEAKGIVVADGEISRLIESYLGSKK